MTNKAIIPSIPGSVNGILDEAVQNGVGVVYTIHALKADSSSYGDLTGYVITGVKQDTKGNTSSITGTLAWSDAENSIFTWTVSAADVGTEDEFGVYFTFTSGGTVIRTKRLVWKVQGHPSANVVAAPGVTGVSVAEGAWLTQAVEAGEEASGGNLVQWNNDGTIADSGRAKTEIGDAVSIRARPVANTAPTDGQVLTYDTTNGWQPETPAGGGVTDHGALTGLGDDDHTQYAKRASNLSDLTDAAAARSAIGAGTGDGDVTGPASSVDNQIARFDLTTGKIIQAGTDAPTYDDAGRISAVDMTLSETPGSHAAAPTLAFGDGDTGFYESANNILRVTTSGVNRFMFWNDGAFHLFGGTGGTDYQLRSSITPSATVPGVVSRADYTSGLGYIGTGRIPLISNSRPAFMPVYLSGVVGSAQSVIPNGPGDVTLGLSGTYTISDGAGNFDGGVIDPTTPGNSFNLYDDGGTNTCQLQVAADGSVTVIRTAGSRTYSVNLTLNWQ